jgi:hypothetical protein
MSKTGKMVKSRIKKEKKGTEKYKENGHNFPLKINGQK